VSRVTPQTIGNCLGYDTSLDALPPHRRVSSRSSSNRFEPGFKSSRQGSSLHYSRQASSLHGRMLSLRQSKPEVLTRNIGAPDLQRGLYLLSNTWGVALKILLALVKIK
ncbi:hypothetical protein TNCV_3623481, partial [Trichonephila clavipes]